MVCTGLHCHSRSSIGGNRGTHTRHTVSELLLLVSQIEIECAFRCVCVCNSKATISFEEKKESENQSNRH